VTLRLIPTLNPYDRERSAVVAESKFKSAPVLPRLTRAELNDLVLDGDAFDLFARLPESSIDLIITSPPYWGHREYGLNHSWELFNNIANVREYGAQTPGYEWYRSNGGLLGLEPYPEWYVTHLADMLTRAYDALKADGNLWVNIGDTYFARWSSIRNGGRQGLGDEQRFRRKTPMGGVRQEKQLLLIPSRFAIAMQERGWILRNDLIWYKPNATPRPEGDRLKLAHEHFFHFVKKPKEGRASYFYQPQYAEGRNNDVVTVNVASGEEGHTATFPHALIEPRILTSSPMDGIVLDPFCGTGRALEVAKRLGRIVVGFDAQKRFVELTRNKLGGAVSTKQKSDIEAISAKGNFVSEWFGQRIYPKVRLDIAAITGKKASQCPFLTNIQKTACDCVKSENSRGVCTISSSSNGPRQDWLVCPYRVIDSEIVKRACARIFGLDEEVLPLPVSILSHEGELEKFKAGVKKSGAGYLFFQDKLGGEISVIATERSPEMAFDVTLVEVTYSRGAFNVNRYGILEIQTMDFHGSYKHAVTNLRDALRLHGKEFPEALQNKAEWAGKNVEGPNIANVFKRTFYQIMLKFKLSGQGCAAGTVLALPRSVWDSWQPFLGAPDLEDESSGIKRFKIGAGHKEETLNSFICVFDLDSHHNASISPVTIDSFIRVSPDRLAHHAFTQVPDNMLHAIKSSDAILFRIKNRLLEWWPDLQGTAVTKKATPKKKKR
jgi:DNA modification methylase